MRKAFSSIGMSALGIAASPSSTSPAACSRCRPKKRGGSLPRSFIPARLITSWSCATRSSISAIASRPAVTRKSCCADTCNGATRLPNASTDVCPIWDVATEELFLVRDRMGVKPLFYYPTADGVLFGSEPKAILAHPWVRPRVNKDGLREILVLAKNPEVMIYAGMYEVRPGQVVRVNRDGITKRRYPACFPAGSIPRR